MEPINTNQSLPEKKIGGKPSKIKTWFISKKRILGISFLSVMIIASGLFYYFRYYEQGRLLELLAPPPKYVQAYSLVEDKISQSAPIVINLPSGLAKATAMEAITFTPKVQGSWQAAEKSDQLIFKPERPLDVGKYYTVTLTTTEGTIGKDFLAAEDPGVVAIFPKGDSETNENSKITVVFNRPMVPLTTLDILDGQEYPIEIAPVTAGKFKWISTRTLQFIPKERLELSSTYNVRIAGFVAMDGLTTKPMEHTFTTRKLRYNMLDEGRTIYNEPINIYFNQPVNLEKTAKEIIVTNLADQKEAAFIAEYGTKSVYDEELKQYKNETDESVILVYNRQDKHGRGKLWDFKNNYRLKIARAYPLEGEMILEEERETDIQVTDIISSISATSERTNYADLDFFDPQGKLVVEFFEEIDYKASSIQADKLSNIEHGEKCREDYAYADQSDCEKVVDKKTLYLFFDHESVNNSEKLAVEFRKIKNTQGQQINREVISKILTVIPKLQVVKTNPAEGAAGASLTLFTICSTTPLAYPQNEEIDDYIQSDLDFSFSSWRKSYRISESDSPKDKFCEIGEFKTYIHYGLMPQSHYNLSIKASDAFSDKAVIERGFQTGEMPESRLNFHHFQGEYNVTPPDKTRLTYAAVNMEFADLDICRLSAEDMLAHLESKDIGSTDSPATIKGCTKRAQDRIVLPKKYWIKNYFKVDIKDYFAEPLGNYILAFSHPNYATTSSKSRKQIYEYSYLTVTNLSIVEKKINAWDEPDLEDDVLTSSQLASVGNLYWVTNLRTLEPVFGASVEIFQGTGESEWGRDGDFNIKRAGTFYTDQSGIARTKAFFNLAGAVVTSGSDSALISDLTNDLKDYNDTARPEERYYIYTDRPIYRPGDRVYLKGIYRLGYDANYEILSNKKIKLLVRNSGYDEIYSEELALNDFGTFNTDFIIDVNGSLGRYQIEVDDSGYASFDVQEYVPAPFQVVAQTDKEEYISGETMALKVDADYYFGAPVEGGEASYAIATQNYYFDKYQSEYFDFGQSWYWCYDDCEYGDKFILRNKVALDKTGEAVISEKLDLREMFSDPNDRRSKIVVVYVTAQNTSGQAVSTQKSFILHGGEYYLGVKTNKSFLGKSEEFEAKVKSVDTAGKPLKVRNIDLVINKVKWLHSRRQEVDGGYYYRWEKQLEPMQQKNIATDESGDWRGSFSLAQEGEYEITLTSTDSKGNEISTIGNLYVYGQGYVEVQTTMDTTLEVTAEKNNLAVGERASVIIKSPYEKAKALVTTERGRIFNYEILDIEQSLFNYTFDVLYEHIPNVYTSVVLLSPGSGVKYGNVRFAVKKEGKELDIAVNSDKERYLPGENVTLRFSVKDYEGKPVEAEFSVAVVDMSVLALKGNPKKNPLVFFYDGFPLTVATFSNVKNILYEHELITDTKGGGGGEPDDLAKKKRGVFEDTAYWQAIVKADQNGEAAVNFVLPDNLTTWQVESIGLTKDTKLGVGYQEFTARKELMANPLKPRFIVPGDEFSLGAKIFNQTGKKQKLSVQLTSSTLELLEKNIQSIQLADNETKNIYFKVRAPQSQKSGAHQFIVSAKNEDYEDTVENSIKITPNDTYEATATSHYSKEMRMNEFVYLPENIVKDRGELTIKTSATLAVFLSDALEYMLAYPYGCSEQAASKLETIAVVQKGLNLKNVGEHFATPTVEFEGTSYAIDELVDVGLARLYQNQKSDGGFAYYPEGSADVYLTMHLLGTFRSLEEAGYEVSDKVMDKAFDYLNYKIAHDADLIQNENFVILAYYALSSFKQRGISLALINKMSQVLDDEKYIQEDINNTSLATLALILADGNDKFFSKKKDKEEVYKILENRINIDSRGAFLATHGDVLWQYYETPIKNTALLLKALVADERDNAVLDNVLRWLLHSRGKDGAWGSTNSTLAAMEAMIDYLKWQRENEANFTLTVLLNGEAKNSFDYNSKTLFAQNTLVEPVGNLDFGVLNTVAFQKENKGAVNTNTYYDMSLRYYLPIDAIPPRDEGFMIKRTYHVLDDKKYEQPVTQAKVGDVLRVHLEMVVPQGRNFVAVEDFIPAGVEVVNLDLATTDKSLEIERDSYQEGKGGYGNSYRGHLWSDKEEARDDRLFMFVEYLSPGTYEFNYYVRVLVPGKFHHLPAVVSEMYYPENFGRTSGNYFIVEAD